MVRHPWRNEGPISLAALWYGQMMRSTTSTVPNAEIDLHVVEWGDPSAELVIALHGWPDSSRGWSHVAPLLAERFRVITPDNRGFGSSSKPIGTDQYRMAELIGDVMAIADWAEVERFHLVGHDFGAAVTWAAASFAPQRIRRAVTMAAPHVQVMHQAAGNLRQITKSTYTFLMNIGEAGERLLMAEDFGLLERFVFSDVAEISIDDREAYKAQWRQPGAFTAMAEWYRAHFTPDLLNPDIDIQLPTATVPIRYLHGAKDFAFVPYREMANAEFVAADYDEFVLDTSHWMLYEAPERVAELVLDWLERD